jgi:hypothetical protein
MLSLDNQSITVAQFRQVIHGVIAQTQYQLDDLLFYWWPEIDLNLRDDLGNRRPGHSFVTDPQNHLQGKFRLLSQRVFAEDGGLSWTPPSQLLGYLRRCDRFVQYMFSAIYGTSGMPARGVELRSIRWANILATPRNVVCFQGRLTLIFPYNKACTTTNNSFLLKKGIGPQNQQILEQWDRRLEAQEEVMQLAEAVVAKIDHTLWFKRNKWPQHLAESNLRHLSRACRMS